MMLLFMHSSLKWPSLHLAALTTEKGKEQSLVTNCECVEHIEVILEQWLLNNQDHHITGQKMGKPRCYKCGKPSHLGRDCRYTMKPSTQQEN